MQADVTRVTSTAERLEEKVGKKNADYAAVLKLLHKDTARYLLHSFLHPVGDPHYLGSLVPRSPAT